MSNFLTQADRFTDWCRHDALPFWANAARDKNGGYHEQLLTDGTPDMGHSRRVRVQARLAYVYAHAQALGWYHDANDASDHAWGYMLSEGFQGGEKGCAHLLNADGTLLDGTRDTYAQAFVLLAGAWRYQAFGDEQALKIARTTHDYLNAELKARNGGWVEGSTAALPRRQNPHMHLFEAFLALYAATNDGQYLEEAKSIFDLFETHFFDSETGVVREFFNPDWTPTENNGGPIEPGHMMEWCWLLRRFEQQSGVDVSIYADTLFNSAIELGLNLDMGLLYDSVDAKGKPTTPTLRSWPQTEYIKACIAQARAGRPDMAAQAAHVIQRVFETYLNAPVAGGWHDTISNTGEILTDIMPSSTFYHWLCAAAEVADFAAETRSK